MNFVKLYFKLIYFRLRVLSFLKKIKAPLLLPIWLFIVISLDIGLSEYGLTVGLIESNPLYHYLGYWFNLIKIIIVIGAIMSFNKAYEIFPIFSSMVIFSVIMFYNIIIIHNVGLLI